MASHATNASLGLRSPLGRDPPNGISVGCMLACSAAAAGTLFKVLPLPRAELPPSSGLATMAGCVLPTLVAPRTETTVLPPAGDRAHVAAAMLATGTGASAAAPGPPVHLGKLEPVAG